MTLVVSAPALGANEDTVMLAEWLKDEGAFVHRGEALCGVETTKAQLEVEAEEEGFLFRLAETGARVPVGAPIAVIAERVDTDVRGLLARAVPSTGSGPARAEGGRRWTRKAEIVARRLGIDIATLADRLGRPVTEADVTAAQAPAKDDRNGADGGAGGAVIVSSPRRVADLHEDRFPAGRPERVLLLGGGAGAGAMTVDVLSRTHRQRAVGILDGNAATHGKTVGGVPVLGPLDAIEALWTEGFFDAAIILFTQDIAERAAVFGSLKAKGIRFANVIDPSVEIRGGTTFGEGNLVMANAFFSTAVTVGDNNFFASHCCIEHHSRIGSHCTFGPRTTTSGAVTIGDRVKTGMAVSVEPYLTIGSDSLIASGAVITADIPPASVVKARQDFVVRPRPEFGQ